MNYNKTLTENLQKLLHSRQTLRSSSINHPSIASDINTDDFEVGGTYKRNNIQTSSTAQPTDASETTGSCSSKVHIRSSIEEVEPYNLVPSSETREKQVRNSLKFVGNVFSVGYEYKLSILIIGSFYLR